ncbi:MULTISPECIES: sigma-70 family RNA polymerase sigma factor [unclassified Streptomyces]|uniref:RNA polymerase sigma factor n=1 Tax=unclassified Streptomyces TaxID=2593676 RepID=UPI00331695D1
MALCLSAALAGMVALLVEWQRRATFVALVTQAPPGTVVVQKRGRAMEVHVGSSPETDEGESGVTERDNGKTEQVAALWDREAVSLTRYAMVRTGGDQATAEDLVQQTFMAAFLQWKSLASLDVEERRKWLRRVCRNKWIDGIRREVHGERTQPELERLYEQVAPDPADAVIALDDLDRCLQAIRELPPRRRQVALLYFVEQQSELRIAQLLDIAPSGVRKHVARARRAMREAMDDLGAETAETSTLREGEGELA